MEVGTPMSMNSLVALMHELAADRFTGRVTVRGGTSGWVYLDDGAVSCAERSDRATLLVEMAEAGLFAPEEWRSALCRPYGSSRWQALVGDDPERTEALARFARDYVASSLTALARQPEATVAVANHVCHPFGTLDSWSVDELVADDPADESAPPVVDRVEFLELLEEITPAVRPVAGSAFAVL